MHNRRNIWPKQWDLLLFLKQIQHSLREHCTEFFKLGRGSSCHQCMLCICQFLPSKPTHSLVLFQAFYKGDDPAIQSANVAHSRLSPVTAVLGSSLCFSIKRYVHGLFGLFWSPQNISCNLCQALFKQHMQSKASVTHCVAMKNKHYSCDQGRCLAYIVLH